MALEPRLPPASGATSSRGTGASGRREAGRPNRGVMYLVLPPYEFADKAPRPRQAPPRPRRHRGGRLSPRRVLLLMNFLRAASVAPGDRDPAPPGEVVSVYHWNRR